MRTTIDAAGRVIIPKTLRLALGLTAGQVLELRATEGKIEIEVAPTAMKLEQRDGAVVAVPEGELPMLTAAAVREALEAVRR